MIKISYTNEAYIKACHLSYVQKRIKMNLKTQDSKKLKDLLPLTDEWMQEIAISNDIEQLADKSLQLFKGCCKEEKSARSDLIQKLLGYSDFYDGLKIKIGETCISWNRDQLMRSVNTQVCPYCGRQYVGGLSKTIASCDHYYPKEEFPLLSINMYNLIPSCHVCNSVLKGDRVKKKMDCHLYPYQDDTNIIRFEVDSGKNLGAVFNLSPEDNKIKVVIKDIASKEEKERAKQSLHIFRIQELYESHQQEAYKIRRALTCTKSNAYIELFNKNYKGLGKHMKEIEAVAFSYREKEPHSEPLVKFKQDIERQFYYADVIVL